jgi:putative transposase
VDPGSPWQNGHIGSFNGKLRDELLSREVVDSMWEIKIMLEEHRNAYNHYQPHGSLRYLTPHEFVTRWHQQNQRLFL